MKETILHYNYATEVCERYDMTKEEALAFIEAESESAKMKNFALILTGKGYDNQSFFDACTAEKISQNFTWIHFCPQEILGFDDEESQEEKYYVLTFSAQAVWIEE